MKKLAPQGRLDDLPRPDPEARWSSKTSAVVNGVRVDALSMAEVVDKVLEWTTSSKSHVAVGINAHVCNQAIWNRSFRRLMNSADIAYADGQSVVWAARALGTYVPERVATTDLVFPLIEACARERKRVFLLGAHPGVAARAAERLRQLAPGLEVATQHGYLPPTEMAGLVQQIRDHGTEVLLVGMGDPLQQKWVARYRDEVGVPAILTCGGLFDWTSGRNRRPPQWMVSAGLEWLWRVRLEPSRLGARYLLGNPIFLARFAVWFLRSQLGNLGARLGKE